MFLYSSIFLNESMVSLKRKLEIHCKCEDSAELNVLVSDVISLKERKT